MEQEDRNTVVLFRESFDKLYNSEVLSDFTISCGGFQVKVHKAILAAHSGYFYSLFKGGAFKENGENCIRMQAAESYEHYCDHPEYDDEVAVRHMCQYFYRFDYYAPAILGQVIGGRDFFSMVLHAKILAAATKYQVRSLQRLAIEKFRAVAKLHWQDRSFAEAIRIAYSTTPEEERGLRDAVIEVIKTVYTSRPLSTQRRLLDEKSIKDAMLNSGAFSYDVVCRVFLPRERVQGECWGSLD